jgi:hypothetical protein
MSQETSPSKLNLKEIAKKAVQLSAAATLSANVLSLRAEAYPVLFTNNDPQSTQTRYYADYNPKTDTFTGTYRSNPGIKATIVSPVITYGDKSQDALVQYKMQTTIKSNFDMMNTQYLSTLDHRFISEKEFCVPSTDGNKFERLPNDPNELLPGTPVLQCPEPFSFESDQKLRPIAKTGLVFSRKDPHTGKAQYFKVNNQN